MTEDMVNHPPHYQSPTGFECIDVSKYLIGSLSNTFKYVYRHRSKNKPKEDLEKALYYLEVYMDTAHGKMSNKSQRYFQDLNVFGADRMKLYGVLEKFREYVNYLYDIEAPEADFMMKFHEYLEVASNGRDYSKYGNRFREMIEKMLEEYEDSDK